MLTKGTPYMRGRKKAPEIVINTLCAEGVENSFNLAGNNPRLLYYCNYDNNCISSCSVDSPVAAFLVAEGWNIDNNIPTRGHSFTNKEDNMTESNGFGSIMSQFMEKYKSMFIPVEDPNLKIALDGNVCVRVDGGNYNSINAANEITTYDAKMTIDMPIFSMQKTFNQIVVGDIVRLDARRYAKVIEKKDDGSLKCIDFKGVTTTKKGIKDFMLGQAYVDVVVNLFTAGNAQTGGFNPMMIAMASGKMDFKDIMMMQMFNGGGMNFGQMNPMMLMMLMGNGKSGGSNDFMQMMLMMQMMNQGQNQAMANPFAVMFGQAQQPAAPQPNFFEQMKTFMEQFNQQVAEPAKKSENAPVSEAPDLPAAEV